MNCNPRAHHMKNIYLITPNVSYRMGNKEIQRKKEKRNRRNLEKKKTEEEKKKKRRRK